MTRWKHVNERSTVNKGVIVTELLGRPSSRASFTAGSTTASLHPSTTRPLFFTLPDAVLQVAPYLLLPIRAFSLLVTRSTRDLVKQPTIRQSPLRNSSKTLRDTAISANSDTPYSIFNTLGDGVERQQKHTEGRVALTEDVEEGVDCRSTKEVAHITIIRIVASISQNGQHTFLSVFERAAQDHSRNPVWSVLA